MNAAPGSGELIPLAYLASTHARRVRKVLFALFKGAVNKDGVSRTWCKVKANW